MPKNQFQRPLPVVHTHNVPRHGKAQPVQRPTAKVERAQKDVAALPTLRALLTLSTHP